MVIGSFNVSMSLLWLWRNKKIKKWVQNSPPKVSIQTRNCYRRCANKGTKNCLFLLQRKHVKLFKIYTHIKLRDNNDKYVLHLFVAHNIEIAIEKGVFKNFDEFLLFKKRIENQSKIYFETRNSRKNYFRYNLYYFDERRYFGS